MDLFSFWMQPVPEYLLPKPVEPEKAEPARAPSRLKTAVKVVRRKVPPPATAGPEWPPAFLEGDHPPDQPSS